MCEYLDTAKWLLREEFLQEKRYSRLGLTDLEANAIAEEAAAKTFPANPAAVIEELEERLKRALDDKAIAFTRAQMPVRNGFVTVQKLPPRKARKALRYDYKPTHRGKPIRFCDLEYDRDTYTNVEDYIGHEAYRAERKRGSENGQARITRQEREAKIERLAEVTQLVPALKGANVCTTSREPIPAGEKRVVVVHAELPSEDADMQSARKVGVLCNGCHGAGSNIKPPRSVGTPEDSWLLRLSPKELAAWRLREEGLTQAEIAVKMGIHQATISRILRGIEGKRTASRVRKFSATGGA